ncbi:hypothetical protein H1Q59_04830 [Holosporaceae bacterium 'Namur']|nr:hypothetical protein [Holosporaceae bacterium 'Namur']
MRKAEKQSEATSPIGIGGFFITVLMVIIAVFSTHVLFLILFGMLPGFIAGVVDRYQNRYLTKIVLMFNFAGVAPYLIQIILNYSQAHEMAIKFILEPKTWLYIYSYSTVGWVVYWCFPNINLLIKNVLVQFKINKLNDELDKLVNEWGKEVKKRDKE